ncbi:lactate racemase domain-containing protein [Paucisalibacillus sp. EB02]|uniref:lactate racemase domain-containing protein n=1 Tax=Paucisalibacillus sp. EB02 TaxID=1347087 RepID=UPI0006942E0A|nr:lactate racemase domain-containing protein [Paucisalibacillus sp. EB02]
MNVYELEIKFKSSKLINLKEVIWLELARNCQLNALPPKAKVAITAGSRGIDNIVLILREIVNYLKGKKLHPFILPAMGSHGGATAEGQVEVLKQLGITEEALGVPIRSSMEVIKLGTVNDNLPVYMDKIAYFADAILVVNRIKSHTAFSGKIESGLSKMVTVGMGKQRGASYIHIQGAENMEDNIIKGSKYAIDNSPICMGLAIVEDSYDQTSIIQGVSIENWHHEEAKLLEISKSLMPSFPVDEIDLLIVEEMGKCYSGTGMDPTIIGRLRIDGMPDPKKPKVKRIAVLDLADQSHGNAQGIGLADFTTEKLFSKVDRYATYMNSITSTFLRRAMFPFIYPTEEDAIEHALLSLGPGVDKEDVRIVQIPNTLHLSRVIVSESALKKVLPNVNYSVTRKFEFLFENGNLTNKISSL